MTTGRVHRSISFDVTTDCYHLPLTKGKVALISPEDARKVQAHVWAWYSSTPTRSGYAYRSSRPTDILLARFIMEPTEDQDVIHINDDEFDFRRSNLRVCGRAATSTHRHKRPRCTSIYKGVSRFKKARCWRAHIYPAGRTMHLGLFDDERRAAIAYDEAAAKLYGEYARLNIPDEVQAT